MRSLISKIIILLLLIIYGCAERTLFTEPGIDPGLGGVYTTISGQLIGTLSKINSPYLVADNIYVPSGFTLTVEKGSTIFFKKNTSLQIYGGIRAIGTSNSQILFRAFVYEDGWEGIHSTEPTDSLLFIFCVIQDVYLPQESQIKYGSIEAENANLIVKNCYFKDNYTQYGGALALMNANSEITNNIFYQNESVVYGGAILSQSSSNKIFNNTIYKNYCLNYGGGLVLVDPVSEDIQNNIFFDNFSYLGDPRIDLVSGDSTNINQHYNFLAFGNMNPLFISETNFHLQVGSACIDAGNPDPSFNDVNGSPNDQGAFGGPEGNW
jgi:hypothetical protein